MGAYAQSYIDQLAKQKLASGKVDWAKFQAKFGTPTAGIMPGTTAAAPASLPVYNPDGTINGQNVMQNYEAAYKKANDVNEERYKDILGGYNTRYDTAMSTLEGLGAQEGSDIRSDWDAQQKASEMRLKRAGLAGTTVMPTMAAGIERQKQADLNRMNERLQRERLGYQTGLSQDTLQFKERRNDLQPDMGMYATLMEKAGNGYGGGGGFGFGGGGAPKIVLPTTQGSEGQGNMAVGAMGGTTGAGMRPFTPQEQTAKLADIQQYKPYSNQWWDAMKRYGANMSGGIPAYGASR